MADHTVVLVQGDGIGPEVTTACRRVFDATGVDIEWIEAPAGAKVFAATGRTVPERTADLVRSVGVTPKGPMANRQVRVRPRPPARLPPETSAARPAPEP